jgi:hypothetical protein
VLRNQEQQDQQAARQLEQDRKLAQLKLRLTRLQNKEPPTKRN